MMESFDFFALFTRYYGIKFRQSKRTISEMGRRGGGSSVLTLDEQLHLGKTRVYPTLYGKSVKLISLILLLTG